MKKAGTGTSESQSAPLSTDAGLFRSTLTRELSSRYARLQPIVQVRHLRVGLGNDCGEVIAGPSEILLDQSDLTSLGFLMLVGHGRELVREV